MTLIYLAETALDISRQVRNCLLHGGQDICEPGITRQDDRDSIAVFPCEAPPELSDDFVQRRRPAPEFNFANEHLTLRNLQVNINLSVALERLPTRCTFVHGVEATQDDVSKPLF